MMSDQTGPGQVLGQDGFSARLQGLPRRRAPAPPAPVSAAPAGRLRFSDNGDGSLTLVKCLDASVDDMNIQMEAGSLPVTAIAGHAFENCRDLQRVVLPPDLRQIGEMAFLGCVRLRRIIIPGGVVKIGTLAFARCTALTHVRIQPGVQALGPSAFSKCRMLSRVDIPSSVRQIGGGVFIGCAPDLCLHGAADSPAGKYALQNGIPFDAESWRTHPQMMLSELEDGSLLIEGLRDLSLRRLEIPQELCGRRVAGIAPRAFFGNTALEQVVTEGGVAFIGESAFMSCTALELASFDRGLLEIGPSAFAGCERLPQIVLPWGTQTVRRMAFFGCCRLSFVKMPPGTRVESLAFEGCSPALRVFGGVQADRV